MNEPPMLEPQGGYWKDSDLQMLVEQVRQDTAREIFEEIEKNQGQYFYNESRPKYNTISISRNQIKWQALKARFLKEEK